MIHQLNRFAQKLAIKVYKKIKPPLEISEYEGAALKICRKLITNQDNVLLMSPISGKRYIKNEDLQLFIVIEERNITIVNHTYSYDIQINEKSYLNVKTVFDSAVEYRRSLMEADIKSNVKNSLHTIFKNVINESTVKS